MKLRKILLILFLPAILNNLVSFAIGFWTYQEVMRSGGSLEDIEYEVMCRLFTYNFYWSIIQVGVGLYAAKLMGGLEWIKKQYSKEDFSERIGLSIALILVLILASQGLITMEQLINSLFVGGWEKYMETWNYVVTRIPLWSKMYLVLIAPFTAGIFEEIIWRGFGINTLEEHMSTKKAVIIQGIAFGLWHGISLHTLITFLIGVIYGYVYAKRRKLLNISTAHILVDIIGFSWAFLFT